MPQPWWRTDTYDIDEEMPADLIEVSGPRGLAVVRAWDNGMTDSGWGILGKDGKPGFMENYLAGRFKVGRLMPGFRTGRHNLAYVMRSMKMVCIDIDGKNGGLQHVGKLGMLPYTLAETSKSGNGFHLFYLTSEDEWDDELGFAQFNDRINIQQGVDIRATGCVYHYPGQRWNNRRAVELPDHLKDMLLQKQQQQAAQITQITKVINIGDAEEVMMLQDSLKEDLLKPIPTGRRNTTLFAIGQQMQAAAVEDWDVLLRARAIDVGLDQMEADKIVANVIKYGSTP